MRFTCPFNEGGIVLDPRTILGITRSSFGTIIRYSREGYNLPYGDIVVRETPTEVQALLYIEGILMDITVNIFDLPKVELETVELPI